MRRALPHARLRLMPVRGIVGRLRGLLGRAVPPGPRTGLWLAPCNGVHTIGMRYAIDIAFIGRRGRVIRIARGVPPGKLVACRGARSVVELAVNPTDSLLRYRRKLQVALRRAQHGKAGVTNSDRP